MTRISVVSFVATLALGLFFVAGCRVHHLGDSHGKAYFGAVQAQSTGNGSTESTPMTAADAKRVMSVHTTGEAKGGDKSSGASASGSTSTTTSSTSNLAGGKWPGSTGNINLEAK